MNPDGRFQTGFDWPSALQFTFSALGVLILWGLAVGLFFTAVMALFDAPTAPETTVNFLLMAGSALSGLLVLPSVVYSGARLLGHSLQMPAGWHALLTKLSPGRLIWAFPLLLLIGYFISTVQQVSWLLLPPLHVSAISLSIGWLLWLGIRRLNAAGSPQRAWGVFASGLVFAPLLAVALEIAFLLGSGLIATIYFASQPELLDLADQTFYRVLATTNNPDHMLRAISDLVNTPGVVLVGLSFLSVVVPLVEELVKPIGVWLLGARLLGGRRQLTPTEGMVAGMISGAGFALYETLTISAAQTAWAPVVAMRTTTSVLHITTTGLLGWALASAWQQRRYGRLVLSYLAAVLVHGIWNSNSFLAAVSGILSSNPSLNAPPVIGPVWQVIGIVMILLLTAGLLTLMLRANQKLSLQSAAEVVEYAAGPDDFDGPKPEGEQTSTWT